MLLSLDYDLTYTLDPDGWDAVVMVMRARGHEFVCVTGRDRPPTAPERVPPMPVVCSPDTYKRRAAFAAGYRIDVWIDDCPGVIEPGRMIEWEEHGESHAQTS